MRLLTVVIVAGLFAVSAASSPEVAQAVGTPDLLPFIERLGFPAVAFYLMWRLVTGELRRSIEAKEDVAKALHSMCVELASLREHCRRVDDD